MTTLFPASVVGSMPRPAWVRDLVFDDAIDPATRTRGLDAAVRSVVALQELAGLDTVTDGEWRRRSYIGVIAELAHGFTLSTTSDGRPFTVVSGELAPKQPGFVADEARFVRDVTRRRVKATLPAPALLGERMWDPELSKRAYPTREAFVRACLPILRREVELLVEAGVDVVQIDDPHLCLFVDAEVRASHDDPDAAAGFAVDAVNELVVGLDASTRPRLCVHLCRRAGARVRGEARHSGGYAPIIAAVNRLRVDEVTMEFSDEVAGDVAVLARLRPDLDVGLGCVGVTPGRIDDAATIVARVERALQHVDARRIGLNPDCGFAPGSGAKVDLDEVYEKLRNEVAAAAILRERHAART
ncbi:MAG TPA: cobalamin-independent methionine synthase II family protein [Nannocystaceae bacterium]|nr:cobalamin-independent methionine synthase II family protein [Nannocystaceae bacterium]